MDLIRPSSEAEMVAAFLRAEIASLRFGPAIRAILTRDGREPAIIERPDTIDAGQNAYRRAVLGETRGFGSGGGDGLFAGFPAAVRWLRAAATPDDLARVRYIDYDYWVELSGGTRLAPDAARRIREGIRIFRVPNDGFWQAADALQGGAPTAELILVGTDKTSPLVVLEGHVRLTAYFLRPEHLPPARPVIIGYSPAMAGWPLY